MGEPLTGIGEKRNREFTVTLVAEILFSLFSLSQEIVDKPSPN
jgi:hypothetical protein